MEPAEYDFMDRAEQQLWWYRALHQRLLDVLVPARGRLLDAGCGTGGFLAKLSQVPKDLEIFGLEYDPLAAARAAEKSGAIVKQGSVNAIPFGNGEFGAVISADVLCHKAVDPGLALTEMRRVLRPDGLLVINMPAFQWMYSAHDRHVHTRERVTARQLRAWLIGAGFVDCRTWYWNGVLFPLMLFRRKVWTSGSDAPSDVALLPPLQDAILFRATQIERRLPFPMFAGGSTMGVARVR